MNRLALFIYYGDVAALLILSDEKQKLGRAVRLCVTSLCTRL